MPILEEAIPLAMKAHRGQIDRGGSPYILHPMRVMLRLKTESEMIVGILHDVVEDSQITIDDLHEKGFSEEVVAAIDCLTKREGEDYDIYIERIRPNPLAVRVKVADLEDNMDGRRLDNYDQRDAERLQRYRAAWQKLICL